MYCPSTRTYTYVHWGMKPMKNGNQMINKELKGKAPNPSFRRNSFRTEQSLHIGSYSSSKIDLLF